MTLTYRIAELRDLPEIVAIYNSTIASRQVTADIEPITVESRLRWFEEHTPDKRPLFIVENSTQVTVGWLSFQSFYGRPAYDITAEVSIYLHPAHRNQGFGRQILEYAIINAPNYGIKTLLGFIFAQNTPSIALFERLGFAQWAFLPNIAVLDSNECSLVILGKRVG